MKKPHKKEKIFYIICNTIEWKILIDHLERAGFKVDHLKTFSNRLNCLYYNMSSKRWEKASYEEAQLTRIKVTREEFAYMLFSELEKNTTQEFIEEPVGQFILDNVPADKQVATNNGMYIHYSDVCTLLKKHKDHVLKQYYEERADAIMQTQAKPVNWIDVKERQPEYEKRVRVKLDDGTETLGFINDNDDRTCWLTKGTGGQYWRSFTTSVTHWAEIEKEEL